VNSFKFSGLQPGDELLIVPDDTSTFKRYAAYVLRVYANEVVLHWMSDRDKIRQVVLVGSWLYDVSETYEPLRQRFVPGSIEVGGCTSLLCITIVGTDHLGIITPAYVRIKRGDEVLFSAGNEEALEDEG